MRKLLRLVTGRSRRRRVRPAPFVCPHVGDTLCKRYGCPDDPNWHGDMR